MKSRWSIACRLLPVLLAALVASCGEQQKQKPQPPPAAVTVETVATGPFRRLLTVTGTVEPTIVAGLASQAEGPVLKCRIREGDTVAPGQELLRIGRKASADAALTAAREDLRRQETEFQRISALVREGAIPGEIFDLEIIRAYPELDRRLRNRAFEAALPPDAKFSPGMFARIRAVLEVLESAVTIPVDTVLTAGEHTFVFVLEDGKAVRRKVETGFEQDGRVCIRKGLDPGEKLIIGGVERVRDGAPVRLEGDAKPQAKPAK